MFERIRPPGSAKLLEDRDLVAERREIVGHRQRGRSGADAGDALAVLLRGDRGQPVADVVAQIGRDALQAADRDRLVVDARAAAGRLARSVAGTAQDAGEHVGLPVEHVRVGVPSLRDQPDVLGNVGVRRAGPLAIDDLVEVARIIDVCRLHPWGLRSERTLDRSRPSRHGKTRKPWIRGQVHPFRKVGWPPRMVSSRRVGRLPRSWFRDVV